MKIMGIDQSYTSTGIVVAESGLALCAEVVSTERDLDDELDTFKRSIHIRNEIIRAAKDHHVDKVHIEGLSFGSVTNATRNLAGLQYMIVTALIEMDIPVKIIAPTTLKKFATGSGKAKKIDMYDSVATKDPVFAEMTLRSFKKTKGGYDVADAFWLAVFEEAEDAA